MGAGVDEIRYGFSLCQVEFVVEKGSLGELTWKCTPAADFDDAGNERLDHECPTMSLQLKNVFAGIGVRGRKEQGEPGVDGLVVGIEESGERCPPRRRQVSEDHCCD